MKKIITALLLFISTASAAQNEAASFLTITADPRTAAMGGLSTSLASDAYAVFGGSAAGAFAADKFSLAASYSPAGDKECTLWAGAGYVSFGKAGALTAGFRHYAGRSIEGYDEGGNPTERFSPRDMAAEAGYAVRLHPKWSLGVTARCVSSALWTDASAATFGADLQAMFRTEAGKHGGDLRLSAGLRNVGGKLSFGAAGTASMPATAGLHAAMEIPLDAKRHHTLSWVAGGELKVAGDKGAIFGAGAEYFLYDIVGLRCGYHIESDGRKFIYINGKKNNLNYASLGAALKFRFVRADFAYMLGSETCPMNGQWSAGLTLRF